MDLSVLHLVRSPERNYKWKDRLNSLTGHLSCRLLEWSGWYNQDMLQRLLGHYRLYQLFKIENNSACNHLSLPLAYIMSYRASQGFKYALSSITAALYYVVTFGKRYTPLQIEGINHLLVRDKATILQQFLQDSEKDFPLAISKAFEQIASTNFFNKAENRLTLIQQKNEYNHYQTSSHYFNDYTTTVQPDSTNVKGKEKGVFSKKQLLLFFDLIAESKAVDKIDYSKPNKFDGIATMLRAVSGKSKDSILEQLKDTRTNGLYSFRNEGELKQLIITLTNLSDIFRKAGFRVVANIADKKLRELERV
ncbi:hypothetical protein [Segetibacter koreensis]|uniref:hypothetical protein n=1 Tax=Segetibacter koreensis TaxID=398037 RepID=UPI000368EFA2|nr:hypothetical protein [Segetibacter koreensis]